MSCTRQATWLCLNNRIPEAGSATRSHLLILCDTATPRDIVEYDRIVCAEMPDVVLQPRLHAIVKRCMIHGPCGVAKKSAPCSRDGRCSKRFPKAF